MKQKLNIISIIPLLIFVAIFLGSGLYFDNFYSLPAPIIALFAVVIALLIYRAPLNEKIALFFKGAGDSNVLQMCVIALLAGAFASVAKASGSIDSIVNMGMYYISPQYFPVGIFVMASFLSFATGTSVGTIMTLSPIVFNLATEGLGKYTAAASGIFMAMVCGGGILPAIQGWAADAVGYIQSYWVIVLAIAYLLFYALVGSKNVNTDIDVA